MPRDLPPELVAHILTRSLPPASAATWSERSSALRTYSLLSRAWRKFAQTALFESPVLPTSDSAHALMVGATTELAAARSLFVGSNQWEEARSFGLERLRELTPGVEELRAAEMEGLSLHLILAWPGAFLAFQVVTTGGSSFSFIELRRLALSSLRLVPTSQPLPVQQNLSRLHLSSLDISSSLLSSLLDPSTLPSLTTLTLKSTYMSPSALFDIAPQIRILSLESLEFFPMGEDSAWESLVAYDHGWGMDLRSVLKNMGSARAPRNVRISQSREEVCYEASTLLCEDGKLQEWAEGVEKVWLEPVQRRVFDKDVEEGEMERVEARLHSAGVEVVESGVRGVDAYLAFQAWVDEVEGNDM